MEFLPDFFVFVLSSNLAEPISPERIETDVHTRFRPARLKSQAILFEEDAVGGETEIVDSETWREGKRAQQSLF